MTIDEIRELIRVVTDTGIAELEVTRGENRVRIRRSNTPAVSQEFLIPSGPAMMTAPGLAGATVAQPGPSVPAGAGPAVPDENTKYVKSPIVGTYYESASPGAAPFVKVGDRVSPGQVLCIIESMKLMNEIEAEIAGTLISDNQGGFEGGGIYAGPGAQLSLSSLTMSGNVAANEGETHGGALYTLFATTTLTDVTVGPDNAATLGGGIHASRASFTLTLNRVTIFGNQAYEFGGGLYVDGEAANITNSTISGNTATFDGGGLHITGIEANVDILHATIAQNGVTGGTGAGGISQSNGAITLTNVLIAENVQVNCAIDLPAIDGANISDDVSCPGVTYFDGNVLIGDLALNSPGTTQTHALEEGSTMLRLGTALFGARA